MKHRHAISRGDLLRCLLRCPEAEEVVAALCGYTGAAPEESVAPAAATVEARAFPVVSQETFPVAVPTPPPPTESTARCEFLMPLRFASRAAPAPDEAERTDWLTEVGITQAELSAARTMPAPPPLVPWSRLWPFLHHVLGCRRPGRRVDVRCLVRRLARLQPVRDVPRTAVLAWAPEAWVLLDDRQELMPFRSDFADLVQRLQRQRGRAGLRCDRLDDQSLAAGQARCFWTGRRRPLEAPLGTPVLVLSDLGCLPRQAELREQWRQFGAGLTQNGIHATVLMPCPAARWDLVLGRYWNCVCWDRQERLRPRSGRPFRPLATTSQDEAQRAEKLLDLLSPAIRIEPALLRGARLLLAAHQADVGTEFDAWHHKEARFTPDAMALRPAAALRRRLAFARLNDRLKLAVAQLIRDVHRHWSVTFFARETLTLREFGTSLPNEDIERASRILRRINKTMFEIVLDDPSRARILRVFEWQQADFARCTPAARGTPESAVAWALARTWRGEETCSVPDEIDRDEVARTQERLLAGGSGPAVWEVRRAGSELLLARDSGDLSTRSPVAWLPALAPRFDVALLREDGGGEVLNLLPRRAPAQVRIPLSVARHVAVRSDRGELDFEMVPPPPWATRFGWDRCGLFADFEVGGATFPLRWIPPGEFEMGSPEDEPGRWSDEGPQYRVTIGHGFWLGETPVTQAQYAAVKDRRPAYFQHAGDQAPVEQVSWDDCREFCDNLTKRRELEADWTFRLPTEAEWEYACRAGTTSALYTGPLTIVGERNGPELDAIAWYGGNSGVDYEGGNDSSHWKEKQHEHKQAGTHPVRQKAPNAWGLYDMLGNVWEWCEDVWHGNYEGAPNDGSAWAGEGRLRVYRGGGWASNARRCRCASRDYWGPGYRYWDMGFRLVLAFSVKEDIRPVS